MRQWREGKSSKPKKMCSLKKQIVVTEVCWETYFKNMKKRWSRNMVRDEKKIFTPQIKRYVKEEEDTLLAFYPSNKKISQRRRKYLVSFSPCDSDDSSNAL